MNKLNKLIDWVSQDTKHMAIAGGIALGTLILIWLLSGKKRKKRGTLGVPPKIQKLASDGNYYGAARLAQQESLFDLALEYYVRAQKPGMAAQMAHRKGEHARAAELYEAAGDLHRAAKMYKQAGMEQKAEELIAKDDRPKPGEPPDPTGKKRPSQLLTPLQRANAAVEQFRAAKQEAADGRSPDKKLRAEDLGRHAAEELLAAGETRQAADICKEAGLVDQAVNLYVNLLGDPGAAAPLLAERGDHDRAAQLYQAAGEKERALGAWKTWAEDAEQPLAHLSEVEQLGQDAVVDLLDSIVVHHPASRDNADMHYQIARAYEHHQRPDKGAGVLERVITVVPNFKDSQQLIQKMRAAPVQVQAPQPSAPIQPAPVDDGAGFGFEFGTEPSLDEAADAEPFEVQSNATPASRFDEATGDTMIAGANAPATEADMQRPGGPATMASSRAGSMMDLESIQQLVGEVASAAAREAASLVRTRRSSSAVLPAVAGGVRAPRKFAQPKAGEPAPQHPAANVQVTLHYANDDVVESARQGPSVDQLRRQIADATARPDNVDQYYQLGLAHVAAGQWKEAIEAFQAVDNAQPGFEDAKDRLDELNKWNDAVANTVLGHSGDSSGEPPRYTLMGELGRGGMAVVYRAKDEMLGREVALKFLSPDVTQQDLLLQLFQREARAAAQLTHPNIVTVYDVGKLNGQAYICMELVEGVSIEKVLETHGRLAVLDALRIAADILEGLQYAHSRNIIHRDIKPSNMMRSDFGVCKLMDFGLAKSTEGSAKTTMIAGTPSYMPPEQFTGKNVNAQSDIFAFGASLYEMLTGKVPYEGVIRTKPPAPIRDTNPAVPRVLEKLILKSLALEQEDRIEDASELLEPIKTILTSANAFLNTSAKKPSTRTPAKKASAKQAPAKPAPARATAPKGTVLGGHGTMPPPSAGKATTAGKRSAAPAEAPAAPDAQGPTGTILHGVRRKD